MGRIKATSCRRSWGAVVVPWGTGRSGSQSSTPVRPPRDGGTLREGPTFRGRRRVHRRHRELVVRLYVLWRRRRLPAQAAGPRTASAASCGQPPPNSRAGVIVGRVPSTQQLIVGCLPVVPGLLRLVAQRRVLPASLARPVSHARFPRPRCLSIFFFSSSARASSSFGVGRLGPCCVPCDCVGDVSALTARLPAPAAAHAGGRTTGRGRCPMRSGSAPWSGCAGAGGWADPHG